MPRTVPGAITAKQVSGALSFVYLVELRPNGSSTLYFSSGKAATFNGNTYEANRVKSISGLTAQYIDRKRRDFGRASITFDNGSTDARPFTALEGSVNLDDARVFVHLFDLDSLVGVASIWQGYVKDRDHDDDDYTVTIQASHLFDSPGVVIPSSTVQQQGFGELSSTQTRDSVVSETALPLVWGAGQFKIRPMVVYWTTEISIVRVLAIISGCGPVPFQVTDIVNMKLFESTPASSVDFTHVGLSSDPVPTDLTAFPDGIAHNFVAYASFTFPINDQNRDKIENMSEDDLKGTLANGRPLISTGLPSQNGILIIEDALRDTRFGLGMAATDIDDLSAAASLCGTRWQCRIELREQVAIGDWLQQVLGQIHGYATFNGGKMQLGIKHGAETPVATFAATTSGQSGLRIHRDKVRVRFVSGDSLKNQFNVKYRLTNRHQREFIAYDENAQARAGGTIRKVEKDDLEFNALFDTTQAQISAAIALREEQNQPFTIEFQAPLPEGIAVAPGDLVRVWCPSIPNNATNNVFRVVAQPFETGREPLVGFSCEVYFPSVYALSTAGISIDLVRSGSDVSTGGYPPDVVPASLQLVEKVSGATEGTEAHLRGSWTYPAVDLAGDEADGLFRLYPIASVKMFWRFTDEGVNEWKLGKEVQYPSTFGDFNVPFFKSKSVQVIFVALGLNRAHGSLGYVPDLTKVTALTADLSATAGSASVVNSAAFSAGDFTLTEFEIDQLASKSSGVLNFLTSGGNRVPQFDSAAIAHPNKTQIAVARRNYPSLTLSLLAPVFDYPVVPTFVLKQRKDDVVVKIGDISADNVEDYNTYVTTNASFASDATKLGSSTPSWYLTDPTTPPSGILRIAGKGVRYPISMDDFGGVGVVLFARCAGRNGRNHWSSTLSVLASNSATALASTPPGAVAAPTIVSSSVDGDPSKNLARTTLGLSTANGQSFTSNNIASIDLLIIRRNSANTADVGVAFPEHIVIKSSEAASSSIQRDIYNRQGQRFRIIEAQAVNGDQRTATATSVDYLAGNLLAVDTGDTKTVPAPTFGTITRADGSNKIDVVPITIAQDGIDIVHFKRLIVQVSINGGAFNDWTVEGLKNEDALHASVSASKTFNYLIHRKAGVTARYQAIAVAVGGKSSATTQSAVQGATTGDIANDTAAPGNFPTSAPGLTLEYRRGKLRPRLDLSAITNLQTLKGRIELSIHNGTNSLNLGSLESESVVSGITFYNVGVSDANYAYDLDLLKRMFGASANLKARWKLTNDVGATTSSDSANLPLSGQRDVITSYNPVNIIRNGHFMFNDGSLAKKWQTYDPRSGSFGSLDQTGKLRLDLSEHRAKWRGLDTDNNQRFLLQNLGKTFFKSENWSAAWNIYSNGTPTLDEVVVGLYTQKTLASSLTGSSGTNTASGSSLVTTDGVKVGSVVGINATGEWRTVVAASDSSLTFDRNWTANFTGQTAVALIPQATRLGPQFNLALSTADLWQKGTMLTDSNLDTSLDIYFVFIIRDIIDTTTFPFVDAVSMNSGTVSAGYQRSVETFELNSAGTSENFDTAPTGGSSAGGSQQPGSGGGDPGEILPIVL